MSIKKTNPVFGVENLKKAYSLLTKNEFIRTDFPLDPIYHPITRVINTFGDDFFVSLSKYLNSNGYQPDTAFYIDVPKNEFRYRKIAVLSLVDRIVFQALFNAGFLGDIYNASINRKVCFNPRVTHSDKYYFTRYQEDYDEFISAQINAFKKGYEWQLSFDIERFFDNISQDTLLKKIQSENKNIDLDTISLLKDMLSVWSNSGYGIPQGPFASQVLSNFYLFETDRYAFELKKEFDFEIYRYQDDFALMAKDEKTSKLVYEKIINRLSNLGLGVNHKASLAKLNDTDELSEKLICPSASDSTQETTFTKVLRYRKDLSDIFKNIKSRNLNLVSRKDMSKLKYCLRVMLPFREPYIGELIDCLHRIPSYAVYIIPYIDFNKKFNPPCFGSVSSALLKSVEQEHHPLWARFWIYKAILSESYPTNKAVVLALLGNEDHWLMQVIKAQEIDSNSIDLEASVDDINPYVFQIFGIRSFDPINLNIDEHIINKALNISNKDLQTVFYYLSKTNKTSIPIYQSDFVQALRGEDLPVRGKNQEIQSLTVRDLIVTKATVGEVYGLDKEQSFMKVSKEYTSYCNVLEAKLETPLLILNYIKPEICFLYDEKRPVVVDGINMDLEWVQFLLEYSKHLPGEKVGSITQISKKVPKKDGAVVKGIDDHSKRFYNAKRIINQKFDMDLGYELIKKNQSGDWVCEVPFRIIK